MTAESEVFCKFRIVPARFRKLGCRKNSKGVASFFWTFAIELSMVAFPLRQNSGDAGDDGAGARWRRALETVTEAFFLR